MQRLSRNDLCWCGSGQKYKKCHLKEDERLMKLRDQGYIILPTSSVKTKEQIEGIRKSGELTKAILDMVEERIGAGITTDEINTWVHEYTVENNAYPAPLDYNGFPKSVCTSINNVICHGIPDDTVLQDGDIVNVDVTTILDGYYSDSSRMIMIGDVSEEAKKLVQCAKECLDIGIATAKPFEPINNIGYAIEKYANQKGYSVVRALGGHGVGIEFHEKPHVNHFATDEQPVILRPGMTFTIEPMINEGTYRCKTLSDDWTVVTADGKLSAQWEHTVLVTETGLEILT